MKVYRFCSVLFFAAVISNASLADGQAYDVDSEVKKAADLCDKGDYSSGSKIYIKLLYEGLASLLPMERFNLIKVLAECDRPLLAIDELKRLLKSEPQVVEAELLLAKLLSWNGYLLEAEAVAKNILSSSPKHYEARLVWANAANWRGDYASALPLYRGVLSEKENFDARLNYTYALLATADYHEAKISHWWLYAGSKSNKHTVFDVNQALIDQSKESISWKTEYLAEQGDSRRLNQRLSFNVPFNFSNLSVTLRHQQTSAPWVVDVQALDEMKVAGNWRLNSGWKVSGELGRVVATTQNESHLNAEIGSLLQMNRWLWNVTLRSELFDSSAAILAKNIQRQYVYSDVQYTFNDWFRMNGDLQATTYSDVNRSYEGSIHFRYALRLLKPRIEIGYKYFEQGFQYQKSDYYSPDKSSLGQLTLGFNGSSEQVYMSGEFFYGRQKTSMQNFKQLDNVAGLTLNLNYSVSQMLSINGSLEGGDYALGVPNGYYYYMATVGVSLFF